MKFFGFDISDFVPCEICGQRCVDINHIIARGMGGTGSKNAEHKANDITNLMAMCRRHHVKYGDKKEYITHLQVIHTGYMQTKQPLNTDDL